MQNNLVTVVVDRLAAIQTESRPGNLKSVAIEISRLVFPESLIAFHEIPNRRNCASEHVSSDHQVSSKLLKSWRRHSLDSPVVKYYLNGGRSPVLNTSDLVSDRNLRNSRLFVECWKPIGVTHQITANFWGDFGVAGISIKRDTRYSDHDVALLSAIRSHVEPAWLRIKAEESYQGLTRRESEVLYWVAEGKRNSEISTILGVAPRTISKHIEHILSKLGVENRGAAIAEYFRNKVDHQSNRET